MAVSLSFIFIHLLIFSSYVLHLSVSQPENADCDLPQFTAPSLPQIPIAFSNYLEDPWTPRQLIPPPFTPEQFGVPSLRGTPRQLIRPPFAPTQTTAPPSLTPPPFILGQSSAPMRPWSPGQLIPPSLAPGQSNTPPLPRKHGHFISPPMAPDESSTGSVPGMPTQSDSYYSYTPTQLQLGQQPFLLQGKSSSSSNKAKAVGTAVGVTLAVTVIVAGISICLILKCCKRRRREAQVSGLAAGATTPSSGTGGEKYGKNLKGLIVDEKGQDMVYWRKDSKGDDTARNSCSTEAYDLYKERLKPKEKGKDDEPLIREKSPTTQQPAPPILKVNQRPESQPASVRFDTTSEPPHLPPLGPSGRKGLVQHTDEKENLQPLQREPVNTNVDHNNRGSLSYDGDLMEAMFGSVATKRRYPKRTEDKTSAIPSSVHWSSSQIFLLDPRRSENIASILRSVKVSRQELLNALNEGKGLSADILEKLSRITPTKREESLILAFRGHPPRLAQAESFLYHTIKSVPLAFPRLNAMFFKSEYQTEIQNLDEHVRTLEKSCYELKESGLLFKLIATALKTGNDMNIGAVSGAARSFNLTSLWKLFNVQSPDGKTTIIQSVVEEVAISEGKQCVLDRDNRLNLSRRSMDSSSSISKQNSRKFMILGLPLVSGLSAEFPNVKKAAAMDYYTYFFTASSTLAAGLADIQHTVHQCNSIGAGDRGFVTEFTAFLEAAREELSKKTEEQMRVMQLVKRTTEYYQSGVSPGEDVSPFQLFATVKEFLDMIDQACIYLSENLLRRKTIEANPGSVLASPPPI